MRTVPRVPNAKRNAPKGVDCLMRVAVKLRALNMKKGLEIGGESSIYGKNDRVSREALKSTASIVLECFDTASSRVFLSVIFLFETIIRFSICEH